MHFDFICSIGKSMSTSNYYFEGCWPSRTERPVGLYVPWGGAGWTG